MPPDIHPTANVYRSEIGAGTKVAALAEIGGARIGRNCKIQAFAFIPPGVTLDDDIFIGPHVCFTNDRFPRATGDWRPEPTHVGRGASIGAGSLILPGLTIGANAMIAAGSIVTQSIPDGYLYEGTKGAGRLKRWFSSQAELGLPLTFDEWRERYDSLSFEEQRQFYDAVFDRFPEQRHCTLTEALRFFERFSEPTAVLEIGGWDGEVARTLLDRFPQIERWWNYELSAKAIASGPSHPRYMACLSDQFLWDLDPLPSARTFFAAHTIEHLKVAQLERLFAKLTDARQIYLEAPLPTSATTHSWDGRWNTHILEIGWEQVEALLARDGFQVVHKAPDVRWFLR